LQVTGCPQFVVPVPEQRLPQVLLVVVQPHPFGPTPPPPHVFGDAQVSGQVTT
jgi:hypothetical protein